MNEKHPLKLIANDDDKISKEELLSKNVLKLELDKAIKLINHVQDNYIKLADSDVKEENLMSTIMYTKALEEAIKIIEKVNFYFGLFTDTLNKDIEKENKDKLDSFINDVINN